MSFGTATWQDEAALRRLWQRCFGDPDDYVNHYFRHAFVPEDVFVLREAVPVAMAISFPVGYLAADGAERAGAYLYAVCTAPERRGRGCFRTLMAQAEAALAARGCDFVCLKPGSAALEDAYARQGYRSGFRSREFTVRPDGTDVRFEKINPARYDTLRQLALRGGFIDYPQALLAHQARLGPLFEAQRGALHGFGAAERIGTGWILKEYLGDEALLPGVAAALGAAALTVRTPGGTQAFAMAKPLGALPCPEGYLGLAFD